LEKFKILSTLSIFSRETSTGLIRNFPSLSRKDISMTREKESIRPELNKGVSSVRESVPTPKSDFMNPRSLSLVINFDL